MNGLNDAYVESAIKKAIAGKLTTGQAAAKLGVTKQYVNKPKKSYAAREVAAFRHGNLGKARPWKTGAETEEKIIALYRGKYAGFNFRHFLEKLNEDEGIAIAYGSLHRILDEAGFPSPKRHKVGKGKAKHPSRPRRQPFLLRKRKSFPAKSSKYKKSLRRQRFSKKKRS